MWGAYLEFSEFESALRDVEEGVLLNDEGSAGVAQLRRFVV